MKTVLMQVTASLRVVFSRGYILRSLALLRPRFNKCQSRDIGLFFDFLKPFSIMFHARWSHAAVSHAPVEGLFSKWGFVRTMLGVLSPVSFDVICGFLLIIEMSDY